jgi:GTPase SAR1 family protein
MPVPVPEPTAVAVEVGLEVLKRTVPKGIQYLVQRFRGNKILIVGQPRAGKSSFSRYMKTGYFADQLPPPPRTEMKDAVTPAFTVKMGKDDSVQLEVSKVTDVIGQATGQDHADKFRRYGPHAMLVLLNAEGNWDGDNEYCAGFYLDEFLGHLALRLSKSPRRKDKLKSLVVVVNKLDKCDPKKRTEFLANAKGRVQEHLKSVYGPKTKDIPVMPCILMSGDTERTADKIITTVALALADIH